MVDAADSKSVAFFGMGVRVSPRACVAIASLL